MPSQPRLSNDVLVNVGLAGLIAAPLLGCLLWLAGILAATVTGVSMPEASPTAGLAVLGGTSNPGTALGTPGLNPAAYWITVVLLLATASVAGSSAALIVRRMVAGRRNDPRRLPGIADRTEIELVASTRAVRARSATLRASLHKPEPSQVGYRLGTARGRQVWATVEDSILVLGPPRSGKGIHLVVNAILDAPGPVVTTSTRTDNLAATLRDRERHGPVAVLDPQRLAPGVPAGLRWSPVRGCDNPLTAMIRAAGFAASTGLSAGGVDSGGFWEGKTRTAIQALLHAAALDGRDAATVYGWAINPATALDAVAILQSHPQAAIGWADSLDAMLTADSRTRDSIWQGVGLAFSALADPRVLDSVTPDEAEMFDPAAFLRDNGTVYLLATGAGAGASAALIAAFIEDLVETARRLAARSPAARLDPPLLLALDEIGNLAPLPSLPTLMAEGGGTGITTMPVLQSLAQARHHFGDHQAGAIWDAAIVKILLGGTANARDLHDLSALIGDRDDVTVATTIDPHGRRSHQQNRRRIPILPADRLRTLPFGIGVVLLRSARPIVATMRPWTKRHDADQLRTDRDGVEARVAEISTKAASKPPRRRQTDDGRRLPRTW